MLHAVIREGWSLLYIRYQAILRTVFESLPEKLFLQHYGHGGWSRVALTAGRREGLKEVRSNSAEERAGAETMVGEWAQTGRHSKVLTPYMCLKMRPRGWFWVPTQGLKRFLGVIFDSRIGF